MEVDKGKTKSAPSSLQSLVRKSNGSQVSQAKNSKPELLDIWLKTGKINKKGAPVSNAVL